MFARGNNALKVFEGGGTDVWDDVEILDDANACTVANPCGVDVSTGTFFLCSVTTCDLYLYDTGQERYRHNTNGEDTKYRREIYLSVDRERLFVRSQVTWGTGADQSLELSQYLYNIYAN